MSGKGHKSLTCFPPLDVFIPGLITLITSFLSSSSLYNVDWERLGRIARIASKRKRITKERHSPASCNTRGTATTYHVYRHGSCQREQREHSEPARAQAKVD